MAILAMIVIGIAIAGMFLYLAETIWNDFVDEAKTVLVSDAGAVFLWAFGGAVGCGMMSLNYIWRSLCYSTQ